MDKYKFLIKLESSARQALQQLDNEAKGIIAPVLFVFDDLEKIVGTVTDGDIRRGLINNYSVEDSLSKFMNRNFKYFLENTNYKAEVSILKSKNIRFVPLLNHNKTLIQVLDLQANTANIPASAIIMAGGKGERLLPLTANTPKPLLEVNGKPIIQYNIEQLIKYGIKDIYISLNYLGDQIVNYFGDGKDFGAQIKYIYENEPLGTIGAIKKVDNFEYDTLLVMNSDLLTNIDFEILYETFKNDNADMVVATIPYHIEVPYAVMEIEEKNIVKRFKEKPKYTFHSNAGIYLFKKKLVELIPDNQRFDATDLMASIMNKNYKLVSEPILSYWLDIGRMEDFQKAQEDIKHLKF